MSRLTVKNIARGNIKALLLLIVTVIGLASCKSTNEIVPVGKPANLNVVNADTAALNIYQNGARLNNISSIASGSQTGYMVVSFGTNIYQLKKAGATDYLINNYKLTLDTTVFYTLFIAGETPDKLFLANDGLPPDSTKTAEIRFVNASPSATNLDVRIGNVNFLNQAFKAIGSFKYIAGGTTAISIYQANTTNLLFSATTTLTAGGAYTLYTQGVPGGTGLNKLSAALTINN